MFRRIAPFILTVFLCFTAAAFAQSGHFIESGAQAPVCEDQGTTVRCIGKVAGLGGTTFEITIDAVGEAHVQCLNPAEKPPPGQQLDVAVEGTTGVQKTPRNGQSLFSVDTVEPVFPAVPTCPNRQWTPIVTDVTFTDATLTLFEDGVQVDQVIVPVQ